MRDVWIAGADMTRVGRLQEPLQDLMAVAAHAALRSADRDRPDSIVVATMNPEEFLGEGNFASNVATHMGFANVPVIRVETATSSGAAGVYAGLAHVHSGAGPNAASGGATVRVAGVGQGTDALALRHRESLTSFRATQAAASAAFKMAGFGAERVDVAEIHDAFAPFELISLEDVGLFPAGKAGPATLDGETA